MTTVAIIGAGFSGTILALNLFERGLAEDHLVLIEPRAELGLGQAYSTEDPQHLLNIPATGMSPFPDRPLAFAEFIRDHVDGPDCSLSSLHAFYAARALYGRFLKQLVATQLTPRPGRPRLTVVRGMATELRRGATGTEIHLADGCSTHADRVVLALGNLPPRPPRTIPGFADLGEFYVGDPWAPGGLDDLARDANVLLIGTGLTMLDYVQSLAARHHRGEIIAVSRHGLLPRRHEPTTDWPSFVDTPDARSVRQLVKRVRAQIRQAAADGKNWHSVLNSLRPHAQALWRGFSEAEQARFIRHIRPWWDVHRHRVAPAVAERVETLRRDGRLRILPGHIRRFARAGEAVEVAIRPRGVTVELSLSVGKIVNCSGPNYDFSASDEPLLQQLFAAGRITADRHKLGLQVAEDFATIDRTGGIAGDLFAMGPMLRGQFWEINAVPEIAAQAETLADRLWRAPRRGSLRPARRAAFG